MFELEPDDRITFSDIRRHPVFLKHFPVVAEASKILYSKKFQPSKIIKASKKVEAYKAPKKEEDIDIRGTVSVIRRKDKNYPEEKELLERRKD